MTEPILRASTDRGEHLDPSEDLLFILFTDVQQGEAQFLIVDDLRDRSGHTYFQSTLNDDGHFIVEHRAGSADEHWGAVTPDLRLAHRICTAWAFGLPGWQDMVSWSKVELN